jgi:hypothetical protein
MLHSQSGVTTWGSLGTIERDVFFRYLSLEKRQLVKADVDILVRDLLAGPITKPCYECSSRVAGFGGCDSLSSEFLHVIESVFNDSLLRRTAAIVRVLVAFL